ncbi:very short patch repair endonuclease [Desulfovibrio sp. An276]|nr:very short patch repair endonuclease [Desulfovibrio sp. An276]
MSSIKSKNTVPELLLRKALWREGLRYRVNYSKLPGKPDIVFTKYKIAIFCDGDFWHGHNWVIRKMSSLDEELSHYSEFWRNKINRNIQRDAKVNKELSDLGWDVLRFWESDIKEDINSCVKNVKELLETKKVRAGHTDSCSSCRG